MKKINLLKACLCIRINLSLNHQRQYVSALFVPGSKASEEVSYLKPTITFDYDKDIEEFQKQLNLQGYKVDLEKLKEKWNLYQDYCSNKKLLNLEKSKCAVHLQSLIKLGNDEKNQALINEKRMQSKHIKQEIKTINETLWKFEETLIPEILDLPNKSDKRTPQQDPVVIKTFKNKPEICNNKIEHHLDIARNLNLLDYKCSTQYYLCNEAVYFENSILFLSGKILNNNNFTRVAGSDFSRSILVEGSGMDHEDPLKSFILQEGNKDRENRINRLHLIGNASTPALLAFFTRRIAYKNQFPIKIFSTGRQYMPIANDLKSFGLLTVCQASVVQTLILLADKNEYENQFRKLILTTSRIYNKIGCHYRIVLQPITVLDPSESMRISFEMWSAYLNKYIEVGYISLCGDYFSKRLLFAYSESKILKYPVAITGTLLSVPKILACLLEENPKEFTLSKAVLNGNPFQ